MPELRPSLLRRILNSVRFSRRKRGATIDITPDGFIFTFKRKPAQWRWTEITEIDAGVRDFLTYDAFYIVLFAGRVSITVEETDDGFRQLEYAMLERWPQIKERWLQLFSAPLHKAYYEVLWQRSG